MGLAEVSGILWKERELLELLLFKLEEEQLVLASGRTRWLAHATREVEFVMDQIRSTEVLRAAEVDAVAAELEIEAGPSLNALAAAAPEPWGELLRGHRDAFLTLTAEIQALADANRDLLSSGARALRETLLGLDTPLDTYTAKGKNTAASAGGSRAHFVDEAL
ncbi:flagellar protein FlgN [Paenibacillus sp. TRM 82003]|uniref:flagellar export chaperone FlgN n=1 Tax=Kineococcus sp. TRM81007 TaxID=2925831 RepID=UPI001F5AE37C|nr:flagellar export chaperone FlgN [Kineococcus sp. TRM81007]MCI2240633.1 flagellar protein FlgN [Kineococcus sp. TRM81007]MCI3925444.1 flagellar protein FlgN [Paenibacillus sp. TRM 82003]